MKTLSLCATLALLPASAFAQDATANLMGPDGSDMGRVTLTQTPNGVIVSLDAQGLDEGEHGFHVHETGACSPDFEAAGGHYNPTGAEHGMKNEAGAHAGDMPNIYANAEGGAKADAFLHDVSLEEGVEGTLFDDDGSAIIIHAQADTYEAEAGAGDRVACGIIGEN
ncbi:Cu-Zn family superoxide dismutase [Limimaricola variabilis]|uniref:Cu-Zn family superoxide dismutase n=1 Tax=Limimaricola variabilis TaxID=1492771 RepID=A0ABR6HSF0_9RHOB|nr:superoxide dismutase family protein [Limimaricola variabilis]MBB3713396.1 Cu-Zn family superoxide dismutase [Limimaricola variabilis]